tara:strand:+ start:1651 stop:2058 length:408 start_codon:yes stop_codon:yes gene_type:complete
MKIFKVTTTTLILIFSLNTFSQNTGSKTFPAEIWYCEVNDGFTMEDVRDVSMGVKKFSEENGMKGTQYLTTTFMGKMNPKAFELMTAWPSFEVMGKGFDDFFTAGAGNEVFARWSEVTSCDRRELVTIERTWSIN